MKKMIKVQSAYEMHFNDKKVNVYDTAGKSEEKNLDGLFYVAEAYGITGGEYMVYYKGENFVTPYLVVDINTWKEVTDEVLICVVKKENIASYYADDNTSAHAECDDGQKTIASLYV